MNFKKIAAAISSLAVGACAVSSCLTPFAMTTFAADAEIEAISVTPKQDFIFCNDGYWGSQGFIYEFELRDFAADVSYADGAVTHYDSFETFIEECPDYQNSYVRSHANYVYDKRYDSWEVGTHTVTFYDERAEKSIAQAEINLVESNIESFSLNVKKNWFYDGLGRDNFSRADGVCPIIYYYELNQIESVDVTYKDGTAETMPIYMLDYRHDMDDGGRQWSTAWEYDSGAKLNVMLLDQINTPWLFDDETPENNVHQLEYKMQGVSFFQEITIVENPYSGIDFEIVKPVKFIENTNTHYAGSGVNEQGEEFELYNYSMPQDLLKLTMHKKDGTDVIYDLQNWEESYAFYQFEEENDHYLSTNYEHEGAESNWGIGEHEFNVSFFGYEGKLPVEIGV